MLRFVLAASVGAEKVEKACRFISDTSILEALPKGYKTECFFDDAGGWQDFPLYQVFHQNGDENPQIRSFPLHYDLSRWEKLTDGVAKQLIKLEGKVQNLNGTNVKRSHSNGACQLQLFSKQKYLNKQGYWIAKLTCDKEETITRANNWQGNCLEYNSGCAMKVVSNMGPENGQMKKCDTGCQHIWELDLKPDMPMTLKKIIEKGRKVYAKSLKEKTEKAARDLDNIFLRNGQSP